MTELEDAYKKYSKLGFILNRTQKLKKHSGLAGAYEDRKAHKFDPSSTGYAAIIPPTLIIVDSDSYEDGCMFEEFVKDLGYKPEPFAFTPSGGEHYAFENPYAEKVVGKHNYAKVDIYGGYQSVVPIVGTEVLNKQNKIKKYAWADFDDEFIINPWDDKLSKMLNMKDRGVSKKPNNNLDDVEMSMLNLLKANDVDDAEVDRALMVLPTDYEYDTWIEVGMALYDRYDGSDEGKKRFVAFSKRSSKYDPKAKGFEDPAQKWAKGHLVPNKITYKSLLYKADDAVINTLLDEVTTCDTKEDFEAYQKTVRQTEWFTKFNAHERIEKVGEKLRHARKDKGVDKRLMQMPTILQEIDEETALVNSGDGSTPIELWTEGIIYLDSVKKYVDLHTGERLTTDSMTGRRASELDAFRKKHKIKTQVNIGTLLKKGVITICETQEYNPLHDERVFKDEEGATKLNLYKAGSLPKEADEITEKGQELISKFENHIGNIMSDVEAKLLLDYLAYIAQNVGKKVLYAPLIQSVEGIGKTVVGTIMINGVFGPNNANTVDASVVLTDQTAWATHGLFKVLEEIKVAGHNRFETVNKLKTFITNKTISRVEKYEVTTTVSNFVNYLAFTNHKDAMPVNDTDRRWWIVFSPLRSLEELEKKVGISRGEYFAPLHELADSPKYLAEFKTWLLQRDVSDFNSDFPPESKHKTRAIASEDAKTEWLTETKHLIHDSNYSGISSDVISTRQLRQALLADFGVSEKEITPKLLSSLAQKLGYEKLPSPVFYEKVKHSVWTTLSGVADIDVKQAFRDSMEHGEDVQTAMTMLTQIDDKEVEKEFKDV